MRIRIFDEENGGIGVKVDAQLVSPTEVRIHFNTYDYEVCVLTIAQAAELAGSIKGFLAGASAAAANHQ